MISLNRKSLDYWQENNLEYLRYQYDLKPGELCLDIGSYRKEWGKRMEHDFGVKVEYFEALDNRAAWVYDGEIELGGAFYYSSQLLPPVTVAKCENIAKYLQQEIAVMKINIEGAEYKLLSFILGLGLQKNVRNLQVQFHEVENYAFEEMYDYIAKELSKTHKLTWRYDYVWENWTRC